MSLIQNYCYKKKKRLKVWRNKVLKTNRYPVLSSLVLPCLSIFMRPMVECSFSMINDIIKSRSGRMEIETYSTIMTAKYNLECGKSVALKDPVDSTHSYYVFTSWSLCKKYLETKRDKMTLKRVFSEVTKKRKKETVHKRVINWCIYGHTSGSN